MLQRSSAPGSESSGIPANVCDPILETDLHVLFIGVNDLSYSLGLSGRQGEDKLQEAIKKIVEAGKRHNIPLGRPAGTPEQVQQFMKEGFLFFQAASELGMMAAGANSLFKPLGKSGFDPKTRPLY